MYFSRSFAVLFQNLRGSQKKALPQYDSHVKGGNAFGFIVLDIMVLFDVAGVI